MSAASEIEPTPFHEWRETPVFFTDPASTSQTRVYNDKSLDGTRYAYGVSTDGSSFFIEMTTAEEAQFWQLFMAWRQGTAGDHAFSATTLERLPPTCGTPNTPKCPPDDLLNRKRARLRDKLAGPGAPPERLFAAEVRVNEMLVAVLNAELDLIKPLR